MADRLFLSVWLRNPNHENQISRFERLLRAFPFSKLTRAESSFRILAVSFGEPQLAETLIAGVPDPEAIGVWAKEFHAPDSAFQLDCFWDIWNFKDDDWTFGPAPVSIFSFASEFERDEEEDFRIEFGLDTQFLPEDETASGGLRMIQSNIRSLLSLVKDVDGRLPVERRLLWSESGDNFAELLQRKLMDIGAGQNIQ
jgi:hypothetical protein